MRLTAAIRNEFVTIAIAGVVRELRIVRRRQTQVMQKVFAILKQVNAPCPGMCCNTGKAPFPSAILQQDSPMFSVESLCREEALIHMMETMRTWFDHKHLEPATFRYTFTSSGIILRVDFPAADEAAEFAKAFSGKMTS